MGNILDAQLLFNRVRMWMAGVSFHGRRDLYELFGYRRYVNHFDFTALYYRFGVAKRVVDAPVLGIWTDPPQLVADNVEFNAKWQTLCETMNVWHNIIRFDKLCGLGRFAVMVIGLDDGQKLDQPIIPNGKKRNVIYLQPYHEGAISIRSWETDETNPRYGKPVMYNINPGRFIIEAMQTTMTTGMNAFELRRPFNIHWARLVHIAENTLEDGVFGTSRLEACFNDLNDLMKVSGGSAELFWTLANRGMQINVDKEMDLEPTDAKELEQEVEDYQHQIRRFIRTRGVEIKDLGSSDPKPEQTARLLFQMISASTGIPQSIFFGTAVGNVASHQDRANWSDRLAERVSEYGEPVVLKGLLDRLIWAGVLPNPTNLQVNWPEAFKLNPLERAQTSAQMARSSANLMKSHVASITATVPGATKEEPDQLANITPLFNPEEMRAIVSFGRHPPVFATGAIPTGATPPVGQDPDPLVDAASPSPASTL